MSGLKRKIVAAVLTVCLLTPILTLAESGLIAPHKWKQQGRQTINLVYVDETVDPIWAPVIQQAIARWQAIPSPFNLQYARFGDSLPAGFTAVPITERTGTGCRTIIAPQGNFIKSSWVELDNTGFLNPDLDPVMIPMLRLRTVTHELGHTLALDHNIVDGWLQPSVMGSGFEITQWEKDQICLIYRC